MRDDFYRAESALTDLEGLLHALDIIRFQNAINKPGPELHALNVLIPMAVAKAEELRRAMFDGPTTPRGPVLDEATATATVVE
jgi:hypothetical protein